MTVFMVDLLIDSQSVALGSLASASPENLLEMQIVGPAPDVLNQKL